MPSLSRHRPTYTLRALLPIALAYDGLPVALVASFLWTICSIKVAIGTQPARLLIRYQG